MGRKLKLGIILFVLGLTGILSLLAADINPAQLPPEITRAFTPGQLKLLTLINPTVLLVIAVTVGVNVHRRVNLHAPLIERHLLGAQNNSRLSAIVPYGTAGGVLAGVLLSAVGALGAGLLPGELERLGTNLQLPPVTRLLYGGITEELLLRFGFMSFIAWTVWKLTGKRTGGTYLVAIAMAAAVFGALHLPVVYQAVAAPSAGLIGYVLAGNVIGGLVFGWLYWKRGLEAAIIGHITAHLVMMGVEKMIG